MTRLFGSISAVFLLAAITVSFPTNMQAQPVPGTRLLPEVLETELALSALPVHLRSGAGVLLLESGGYVRSRDSENGFECLVRRHGAIPGIFSDTIAPVCYDAEGAGTVMQAVLDEVAMLQEGTEPTEVAETINERWADSAYDLPGPGISYMLSPVFRLNGRDDAFVPHLMFYAPNKSNPDVGAGEDRLSYVPWIQAAGRPSAVMVVPVGIQERKAIAQQESGLIARVKDYLAGLTEAENMN